MQRKRCDKEESALVQLYVYFGRFYSFNVYDITIFLYFLLRFLSIFFFNFYDISVLIFVSNFVLNFEFCINLLQE